MFNSPSLNLDQMKKLGDFPFILVGIPKYLCSFLGTLLVIIHGFVWGVVNSEKG